jgi:hypothetical protein
MNHLLIAAWSYLALLLLGYGFAGWLLAAFQAPWLIWLGTLAACLHLVRSQVAAIALASSWVVLLISAASVLKAWAPVWDRRVPFEQAPLWAESLLLIWLGAIGLVILLAFAHAAMQQIGCRGKQILYRLLILVWGALGAGKLFYSVFNH